MHYHNINRSYTAQPIKIGDLPGYIYHSGFVAIIFVFNLVFNLLFKDLTPEYKKDFYLFTHRPFVSTRVLVNLTRESAVMQHKSLFQTFATYKKIMKYQFKVSFFAQLQL